MSSFFSQLNAISESVDRTLEVLGVPFADPFNEEGVICDVSDPKYLGRVKVTTKDGLISPWVPVAGSSRGRLSAKYIGTRVMVSKIGGRSERLYITGILSGDKDIGVIGTPVQLPIIDESVAVWSGSSDTGMKCNEGNEARVYVLSNEMGQDAVICLRRNNLQDGGGSVWAWKSLTNGLWVEKGFNPGNADTMSVTQAQENNPGIPKCDQSMLGERHDFTEDRGFRTISMQCRRDENGDYSWIPDGSSPVFFRTTLPSCTEKIHGMSATVDDGNNSEYMICQRYQGKMKWVRQGRRIPHKFYSKEKPLNRIEFLSKFNPIPELQTEVSVSGYDWVADPAVSQAVFDELYKNVPITGTDPELKILLKAANLIPDSAFDEASALKRIANAAIEAKTGLPVQEIFDTVRAELDQSNSLTPATSKLLTGVGKAADVLINGEGEDALIEVGREALVGSISSLSPQAGSVMTGLMTGGVWGAVDSAVAIGLDKLPDEVNRYVAPVVDIAKDLLKGQSIGFSNIVSAAVNGGLSNKVSSLVNSAIGANVVSPSTVTSVLEGLGSGSYGDVSKLFSGLSNLSAIDKLPAPANSLAKSATSALGLIGQAGSGVNFFGNAGLGLDSVQSLLGSNSNPAAIIASGVSGLSGLLRGGLGGDDCPCGEKCRKTSHGKSKDGTDLLGPCGSMSSNTANSTTPKGIPTPNNTGPIAKELGLKDTKLGESLLPANNLDLSDIINKVPRVKDMAETIYQSRFADQTERELELASSFEAVEKSLKIADNNITRVESIERKLIDSLYNLLTSIVYNKKVGSVSVMTEVLDAVRTNSRAIKDLYEFTKALNAVKRGGDAGVRVTEALDSAFNNIPALLNLSKINRENALKILNGGIIPADREWRGLNPDLSRGIKLGSYSPTLPTPFDNEQTLFNQTRVLSESLESKLTDNDPEQQSIFDLSLSSNQVESLKESSDFLYGSDKSLYDVVSDRNKKTNCNE